jgi:hypothetical protein
VNPPEAAIGHQYNHVAGTMLANDRPDDAIDVWHMAGALSASPEIRHEVFGGQALGVR